jgi:hypothetical protein
MVQLSITRWIITILWVSLVSFAAITLSVASQRVFVVVYFVIDLVRKLLDTLSYIEHWGSSLTERPILTSYLACYTFTRWSWICKMANLSQTGTFRILVCILKTIRGEGSSAVGRASDCILRVSDPNTDWGSGYPDWFFSDFPQAFLADARPISRKRRPRQFLPQRQCYCNGQSPLRYAVSTYTAPWSNRELTASLHMLNWIFKNVLGRGAGHVARMGEMRNL